MRRNLLAALLLGTVLFASVSTPYAGFTRSLTQGLTQAVTQGLSQIDAAVTTYILNALGIATTGEQTFTGPSSNLALDFESTLIDYGGAVNEDGVAVSAVPGSRLATTVADGAVLGDELASTNLTLTSAAFDGDTIVVTNAGINAVVAQRTDASYAGRTFILDVTVESSDTSIDIGIGANYSAARVQFSSGETGTKTKTIIGLFSVIQCTVREAASNARLTVSVREIIPTVLDTDDSGNDLHPKNAAGEYQFYKSRDNNESIDSEAFRTTDAAGSGEHYYYQQEMAELNKDPSFDDPTNWAIQGANTTVSDGTLNFITAGNNESARQVSGGLTTATTYEVTYTIASISLDGGGAVFFTDSTKKGAYRTSTGTYTEVFVSSNVNIAMQCGDTTGSVSAVITDLSVRQIPSTSLTTPLRDSEGRYYEEKVKNGGFDVDAEWVLGTDWTISGGVASRLITGGNLEQSLTGLVAGNFYRVQLDYDVSGGTIYLQFRGGATVTGATVSGSGHYDSTLTAAAGNNLLRITGGSSTIITSIDNVSVIEVDADGNPTNVLDGGVRLSTTNYLLNSATPATQTTGSLTAGWYSMLTWNNTGSAAITAGTAIIGTPTGAASDGVPAYFEVTTAGTVAATLTGAVDKFQLQGGVVTHEQTAYIETVATTVTQSENVSESVVWDYGGKYSLNGQRVEGAATQYLLNSEVPVTQTTGDLAVGTYVLWVDDVGSVSVTDNTAVSDAAGGNASLGTPLVFTVSTVGSVDVAVTAPISFFQLEGGTFPTSHIVSTTTTITRPATNITLLTEDTPLTPEEGAGRIILTPLATGQGPSYIFSTVVDGSNYMRVYTGSTGTLMSLYKIVGGLTNIANFGYTHAKDQQVVVDFSYDKTNGMSINAFNLGSSPGAPATDVNTDDMPLGSVIYIGNFYSNDHFNATYEDVQFFKNSADAASQLDDWSLNSIWGYDIDDFGRLIPADNNVTYDYPMEEAA